MTLWVTSFVDLFGFRNEIQSLLIPDVDIWS